jgi:hypothetical protein
MTRARDLANIADGTFTATDLNLSGTLDVSGDATFDTNTLFVDVSANAVGIGTTSPSASFTLKAANNSYSGGFRLEGTDETTALSITHVNGDNFFSGNSTDDHLVLTGSGNVGIGTSSPDTALHVSSSSGTKATFERTGATGSYIGLKDSSGSLVYLGGNSGVFEVQTPGSSYSTKLAITSAGNVGIGETSPLGKLHIKGSDTGATASAQGNSLVLEDTENGLSILSSTAGAGYINFGDSDDNNIGVIVYDHSSNSMRLWTNASERLRIDSSGNLLVRQTSAVVRDTNASGDVQAFWGNQFSSSSATTSKVMIGTGSSQGYVGMSRVNTDSKYITNAYIRFDNSVFTAGSEAGFMSFFTQSGGTNAAERMRIDSSGNLLVGGTTVANLGTTNEVIALRDGHYLQIAQTGTGTNTLAYFYNGNGLVGNISTSGSATAYNTSSDARLKENIADAEDAGAKVDAIQVRQFDWKADGSHQDYGMVAQELMTVAPKAVSGDPESDDMMGVDYSKLVPMLVKEIQSLRARVAQLEGA